jgi:RNA polymerase sigma factor (sigma-70 family)
LCKLGLVSPGFNDRLQPNDRSNGNPETRHSLLVRICDPQNELAWTEFAEIYEPLIYRLARRKGLQHADASDLTQDVLTAVAGAINQWDPDPARGSFRGWLSTVARNMAINLLKSEQRKPRGSGDTQIKLWLNEQADPDGETSAVFDQQYRRELFQAAAGVVRNQFQPTTWQAFWRTCVEGQDIQQVAVELGTSVGNVYVARSRVIARLKTHVEKLQDDTQ